MLTIDMPRSPADAARWAGCQCERQGKLRNRVRLKYFDAYRTLAYRAMVRRNSEKVTK